MRALWILVVLAVATPARAEEETRTERFALPIIATDALAAALIGAGVVMFAGGLASDSESNSDRYVNRGLAVGVAGLLTYVAAPVFIHAAKNSPNTELDLAVRVGVPVVTGLIAAKADNIGIALFGFAAAMITDWGLLAKREVPVTPVAAPTPGGGFVGLAGAF